MSMKELLELLIRLRPHVPAEEKVEYRKAIKFLNFRLKIEEALDRE